MSKYSPVIQTLFVFLLSFGVQASPVKPVDIPGLIAEANLIVVGRFIPGSGSATGHLEVDQVLKGQSAERKNMSIAGLSYGSRVLYGIFFLNTGPGGIEHANSSTFWLPAAPPAYQKLPLSGDLLSRVTSEVTSILLVPPQAFASRSLGLQAGPDLVEKVNSDENKPSEDTKPIVWERPMALRVAEDTFLRSEAAAQSIPFAVRREFLAQVIKLEPNAIGSVWALSGMLMQHDQTLISGFQHYILSPDLDAKITNEFLYDALAQMGPLSPEAEAMVGQFLHSTSPKVRDVAVRLLGDEDTRASIGTLLQAFGDSNQAVKEIAVFEFCSHSGVCDYRNAATLCVSATPRDLDMLVMMWRNLGYPLRP